MRLAEGICSAIGKTPIIELKKIGGDKHRVYGKCEFLNPAGSIKDRPALFMLKRAIENNLINQDTTIIESSSGNMAISLSMICNYLGLKLICVIDPKTTEQNIRLMKLFGATIEYVSNPDPNTGEYLPARLQRVQSLLKKVKNSYWTNQYENEQNYFSHFETTMREIISHLSHVDILFCGVSSCGTIRGCAEYVKKHQLKTKIIAVDALGSKIFTETKANRLLPGLGAAIVPPLAAPEMVDQVVYIDDQDCIVGCHRLVTQESILCGASSGGVLMAYESVKNSLPEGATCVLLFPDRGERYLNTIYSDQWIVEHFGDISHLWQIRE